MKEPLDPKSCGPGNHTCANPICGRCGININEERKQLIAYHTSKPRNKLTPMEFVERLSDLMAEDVMNISDNEINEELLNHYGSQQAVDAAVLRIKEYTELYIRNKTRI